MRCFSSRFFSNLSIPLLLYFCSDSHRNGCQFNMSTNVSSFVLRLSLKAGAKLKLLFVSCKKKFKNFETFFFVSVFLFSLPIYQRTFPVLRGANVKASFESHKLFLNFFFKKISSLQLVCLSAFQ